MKATIDGKPVVVGGKPIQIFFSYGEEEATLGGKPTTLRAVECVIRPFPEGTTEDPTPFSTGTSKCSPLDNFQKDKGRYLAWRRAVGYERLQTDKEDRTPSVFSKEERTALWSWFTNTCRLPRNLEF